MEAAATAARGISMSKQANETDIHDLSLGVIHALAMIDVKALSYVQLQRLYAALVHATNDVDGEIAKRAHDKPIAECVARFMIER